jgi:hypothetical protein
MKTPPKLAGVTLVCWAACACQRPYPLPPLPNLTAGGFAQHVSKELRCTNHQWFLSSIRV